MAAAWPQPSFWEQLSGTNSAQGRAAPSCIFLRHQLCSQDQQAPSPGTPQVGEMGKFGGITQQKLKRKCCALPAGAQTHPGTLSLSPHFLLPGARPALMGLNKSRGT